MSSPLAQDILFGPVEGGDQGYLVSPLTGDAELLDAEELAALQEGQLDRLPELRERGIVVDEAEQRRRLRAAFLDFMDGRDQDEVQVFYLPTYACNFGCDYCFQSSYATSPPPRDPALIPAFFDDLARRLAGRRYYITLFGGEPLLDTPRARADVAQLVGEAKERDLDLAVVTNGYHLESYLPVFAGASVREIQITLDGPPEMHDQRRPLKGGQPTFARVAAAVDASLAQGFTVNLRVVVDRDNLAGLVELSEIARRRGWLDSCHFKTQLGRNYELHACQASQGRLYSRLDLYRGFFELARRHPQVLDFHRPSFYVARHIADEGELPAPLFDACPACKTEWAYDATGAIYPCTATVGKPGEAVGRFYPKPELDQAKVAAWQDRDVLSIDECRDCPSKLLCGGGCGAVAKNQRGRIDAPDCRPVRETIGLGLALYLQK